MQNPLIMLKLSCSFAFNISFVYTDRLLQKSHDIGVKESEGDKVRKN